MARYADPLRCPDCGSTIAFQASRCGSCGLPLHGPLAQQLFTTLTTADRLLAELRASAPVPAPAAVATTPVPGAPVPATVLPAPAVAHDARRPGGLSAASVPKILLALGAGCVLVAALVFLAVTWSVMGVGGRTATLVVFTAATGALAAWMAHRDLRAAAEALALVSFGLLTLDLVGADNAGWFGDLSTEAFLLLLGTVLLVAAVAASLAVRRTPAGTLVGVQVVAGIGVAVGLVGLSDIDRGRTDLDLLVAVVVAGLAAAGLRRLSLPIGAVVAALATGLGWLVLLAAGIDRVALHPTVQGLWLDLQVWPLLGAATAAALPAALRSLPRLARVTAASVGLAVLCFAVVLPALDEGGSTPTLAVLVTLVPLGVLAWFAPRPWGLVAAVPQLLGSLWIALVGAQLVGYGLDQLAAVAAADQGSLGGSVAAVLPAGSPAPWLLPLGLLVLVGTVVSVGQASPKVDALLGPVADLRGLAALGIAAVVLTAALYAPPVWVLVVLLLLGAVAFDVWWVRRDSLVPLGLAGVFLAAAVGVATYDAGLAAGALAVTLGCAVHAHLTARQTPVSQVAGAVVAASLAGLTWSVGTLTGAEPPVTALVGLALLGLLGTTAFLGPVGWWHAEATEARAGLEVGAAAAALPLGLLGVLLAPEADQPTWTAVYLTLAGVAVTTTSLVRPDRRFLAWPGGGLLAAASWVRLWDVGVHEPEAYTLPSAIALAAVGLWHLRTRPGSGTVAALGPALGLALVPSLVWALADPTGLRVLLLGLACLALVLAGVQLRWTAPLVAGAVVGGLLVLRLAGPYLGNTVPRWVLIGAAGALLIATGVTWERRLHEARQVRAYVRGLR